MNADLVGFQEVFHEDALQDVCARSEEFGDGIVVAPGADGDNGPRLGLASRLPVDGQVTTVTDFPAGLDVAVDGIALTVGTFSRPVLRARVVLDPESGTTATVFVADLKSKRPIRLRTPPSTTRARKPSARPGRSSVAPPRQPPLRFLVLEEVAGTAAARPSSSEMSTTPPVPSPTDIITGDSRSRFWSGDPDVRRAYWNPLLYSAHELITRRTGRDVRYTHIFNGYENLDHVLVSQEFYERNPQRIGEVQILR